MVLYNNLLDSLLVRETEQVADPVLYCGLVLEYKDKWPLVHRIFLTHSLDWEQASFTLDSLKLAVIDCFPDLEGRSLYQTV